MRQTQNIYIILVNVKKKKKKKNTEKNMFNFCL